MYCVHCGKELVDEAIICPNCGCFTQSAKIKPLVKDSEKPKKEKETLTKSEDGTTVEKENIAIKKAFNILFYFSVFLLCVAIILIFASINDVYFVVNYKYLYTDTVWFGSQARWGCVLGWISFLCSFVHFILSFKRENKPHQKISVLVTLLNFAIAISASVLC